MATDAEVFGGKALSDADVFGPTSTEDSFGTKARLVGQDVARRAGDVLQLPAAVGDMILGAPANILGRVKGALRSTVSIAGGATRSEAEADDVAARSLGVFESFKTPFQSAVKSLTGAEHYDQKIVEEAFTAASEAVAKKSGGVLTAHGVEMLLGSTLDALGVKGISPTVKAARARAIESAAKRDLAKRPPPEGALTDAEVFAEPKPDLSSIPEPVEVTPKVLKEIFTKAKDPVNAVDNLFAAAREGRFPLKPLEEPKPGDVGAEAGKVEKTKLPDESIIVGDSATTGMRKIILGEEPTLTAEERIALQDVIKPRQLVDSSGKPFARGQEGMSDARMAALLAGFGLGTAGGLLGFRKFFPEEFEEVRARIRRATGMDAETKPLPSEIKKNDRDWKNWNDRFPLEGPDGVPVAGVEDFLGPLAVGMAVKGKGGMWHPEAVSRLMKPLAEKLSNRSVAHLQDLDLEANLSEPVKAAVAESRMQHAWSDRAIRSYLNKHAGTATDPLKDVEVPFGEGVKRWEELTDKAFRSATVEGPKGPETQWLLGPQEATGLKEIQSYLSHVGDFLRQSVAPEKLGQYDLVRAVKETAANDARVAKEMERTSSESTKQLPVYKDYGDGMKWVELKLPEKLTPEQAKGVRKAKSTESRVGGKDMEGYEAIDASGKPVVNSYTQEVAWGRTPEEAYLAGRLAEEGNALGHCVGGYCDAVASGESKIYSLRDAKGKSHVTVETTPPNHGLSGAQNVYGEYQGKLLWNEFKESKKDRMNTDSHETFAEWITRAYPDLAKNRDIYSPDILQIKGAQNRAPVAKYLPYVQDFVRQAPDGSPAKWGEVGDLEGTGLHDLQRSTPGFEKESQQLRDKLGRFVTQADLDKHFDSTERADGQTTYFPREQGSADLELTAAIAAAGGLAAYFAANPEAREAIQSYLSDDSEQVLAAAGVLGTVGRGGILGRVNRLIKGVMKPDSNGVIRGTDVALGVASTRLGNVDPQLKLRLREHDMNVDQKTSQQLQRVQPFLDAVKKLPKAQREAMERAYFSKDQAGIPEAIKGNPELVATYRETRNILNDWKAKFEKLGRFREGLSDYLPLVVKDLEGLFEAIGKEEKTHLQKTLLKAEQKSVKENGRPLSEVERSIVVNNVLQVEPGLSGSPGFAKGRKVVDPYAYKEFYYSMDNSLKRYLSAANQDFEAATFFGKDLKSTKQGGRSYTNIEDSVGTLINRAMEEGRMTPEQAIEVGQIVRARFGAGEEAPHWIHQDFRNVTNLLLLAQVSSAAKQLGDSFLSIYHHGMAPTLKAVGMRLTGRGVSPAEFGLTGNIMEEIANTRLTGKALNLGLKGSGFSMVDAFGKGVQLSASLIKNKELVKSTSGLQELARKWEPAFGERFPALVEELQSGKRGHLTDLLLWSEVADAQAISKAETTQFALAHPNARILYQLKNFMIKQLDVVRRDIYNEIKQGDAASVKRGLGNLFKLAAMFTTAGVAQSMIADWVSGRDVSWDKADLTESLMQTFGLNRYNMDKLLADRPKPFDVAAKMATPAYGPLDDLFARDKKSVKYIPIVGRQIYDRELGGNEARARAERLRERIRLRDELESQNPELRQRRLERKARREAKMRGAQ